MLLEKKLKHEISLPDGLKAEFSEFGILTIEGPHGKVSKKLDHPMISLIVDGNKIKISPKKFTRNEKVLVNTYRAHIRNLIKGAMEQYVYKLKICSSHFPMTVNVEGDKVVIKNFYGEKVPRKAKILEGVKVKIEGDLVIVSGLSKESVGQTSASIEQSTRITNRDRRVFADGLWIVEKAGEPLR